MQSLKIRPDYQWLILFFADNYSSEVYSRGMLCIKNINLQQFKNYEGAKVTLSPQVNCFTGKNGSGKTNMLDALYYLSFTKSYFNAIDHQQVLHGFDYFSIKATYQRNTLDEEVLVAYQKGKKTLKVNNNEVKKFSEHIGSYPLVMITPNDIMLLLDGSEERRRFLDGMISQLDKVYLNDLLLYNRYVEQRNRQLRQFGESGYFDATLLETYHAMLVKHGNSLYEKRKAFLTQFIPVFNRFYQLISQSAEEVNITYISDLAETPFEQLLLNRQQADMVAQRTTCGIHKDELAFTIGGYPVKKFGSQGQQKSFIIALKLAQYNYLKTSTGVKPLLLLDDIFEKLDAGRLQTLLQMIAADEFGQIFITDTHLSRLQEVFNHMPEVAVKYFVVDSGRINEL